MHDAAFAACGIEARYETWDVQPSELASAVRALREPGIVGANVSVPHKRAVIALLDEVSPAAQAIGAVNVVARHGRHLLGLNSDAAGFLRSLLDEEVELRGRRAVLIGAGGAAYAVAWALLEAQVASLSIVNRTESHAVELVERVADWPGDAELMASADPADGLGADLWINATSVGMHRDGRDPDESPVDAALLREALRAGAGPEREVVAVDLVYRPRRTRLLRDARLAGMRTVDGSGMLLHQGAAAFERWTGRAAPLEVMRAALDSALLAEDRS